MSKKDIKENTRIYLTKREFEFLATNDSVSVIVFPLTEEIKKQLDEHYEVKLKFKNYRNNKFYTAIIRGINTFCGKADFNPQNEDMKHLLSLRWFDKFKDFGIWMDSSFDYETCSISKKKPQLQYPCYNVIRMLKYIHALLDYPENIAIAEVNNKELYES